MPPRLPQELWIALAGGAGLLVVWLAWKISWFLFRVFIMLVFLAAVAGIAWYVWRHRLI